MAWVKISSGGSSGDASEPELGGSVVLPRLVNADVGTNCREGAMSGLVRDGPVGGPAEVAVGDKAGSEAVGAVGARVNPGPGYCLLDELVGRFGVETPGQRPIALGDGP